MVIIMVMTKWMNNSHDGGRNGCSATGKHACIGQRDSVGSQEGLMKQWVDSWETVAQQMITFSNF